MYKQLFLSHHTPRRYRQCIKMEVKFQWARKGISRISNDMIRGYGIYPVTILCSRSMRFSFTLIISICTPFRLAGSSYLLGVYTPEYHNSYAKHQSITTIVNFERSDNCWTRHPHYITPMYYRDCCIILPSAIQSSIVSPFNPVHQ